MPLTRQVTRVVRRPQLVRQYCAAATGLKSMVKTYNAISPKGLMRYPEATWDVSPDHEDAHAIMLRSHGLKDEEVTESVRCIARCGAGVNNIPVDRMTERGIPVFNSPGANANAVKELVLCSLLLASRGIVQGVKHTQQMMEDEEDPAVIKKRVEAEKKLFGGQELAGKTLGVIGLGYIGASVAEAAAELGMKIVAYDPVMTVDAAWRLSGRHMERVLKLDDLLKASDYITLHVPYMTQTHHMLDMDALQTIKPTCHLVNFSRGELIDTAALTCVSHWVRLCLHHH
jgi:D-3-phosphoglycerate dehydrogenase